MKRLPILVAGLAVLAVLVYSSIFIVNEREQAIVTVDPKAEVPMESLVAAVVAAGYEAEPAGQ